MLIDNAFLFFKKKKKPPPDPALDQRSLLIDQDHSIASFFSVAQAGKYSNNRYLQKCSS
jgi:hypothetical protein